MNPNIKKTIVKNSLADSENRKNELQYMSQYMALLITKQKLATLSQAS